jgi:hypothetical protein
MAPNFGAYPTWHNSFGQAPSLPRKITPLANVKRSSLLSWILNNFLKSYIALILLGLLMYLSAVISRFLNVSNLLAKHCSGNRAFGELFSIFWELFSGPLGTF